MAEVQATLQQPKEKTNAKKRYLRRKKERRKQKLKTTGFSGAAKPSEDDLPESHSEVEDAMEDESVERTSPALVTKASKEDKPRKKRRRDNAADEDENDREMKDVEMQDIEAAEEDQDQDAMDQDNEDVHLSPQLDAALPSFPLPSLPNAPSKSALALQGLDQALVDAEVVDPSTVLPIPEGEYAGGTMLSEKTRKRLKDLGINELFAVQTSLLPFLLPKASQDRALYQPFNPPRDVCVSAPTGSGKTLAYVLPIIEILSSRIVTRLRALIVLPTRDLVSQVRETFEAVGKGRGLQIGTATGQHSFAHEQSQLVADRTNKLVGGSSKVDILICTPGRLMDHLNGTPNFSLQHLRFLVIDEADRLLAQSFQDWLAQVLAATRPPKQSSIESDLSSSSWSKFPLPDAVAPAFQQLLPYPIMPTFPTEKRESSCQKLLFSATLTRDPGKIAALDLRDPKYFVVQKSKVADAEGGEILDLVMEKFTMPFGLREHMIICQSSQKPLIFFYLIHKHNVTNALVFTKSAESTTRLVRLFGFFEQERTRHHGGNAARIVAKAYSSDLPPGERKSILDSFKSQDTQILICSDLISRGVDISHVSHVVSYDVPVDIRKYVHRVGRTARAGRTGDAWTLVEEQEARYFKGILKETDHLDKVKRLRVPDKDLESSTADYEIALSQLKEVYTR